MTPHVCLNSLEWLAITLLHLPIISKALRNNIEAVDNPMQLITEGDQSFTGESFNISGGGNTARP